MKLRQLVISCFFAAAISGFAGTNNLPKFEELYPLLRSHLGMSQPELDQAAVKGLLGELQGRVILGTVGTSAAAPSVKTAVYDSSYAYFRVGNVAGNIGDQLATSYHQVCQTNKSKIKGVVLDLRFANGSDYAAAAKLADVFLNSDAVLLDWGTGSARATQKTNAISVPVAVLINSKTSGAAEAVAAVLRENSVGLLVGSPSAGRASVFKEFALANGEKVQIASAPVKLANGKPVGEVKPDIAVTTTLEEEQAYMEDPFKALPKDELAKSSESETNSAANGSTNLVPHRRLNEAELVRMQREGIDPDQDANSGRPKRQDPEQRVMNDASLARALDVLKALAVVRPGR